MEGIKAYENACKECQDITALHLSSFKHVYPTPTQVLAPIAIQQPYLLTNYLLDFSTSRIDIIGIKLDLGKWHDPCLLITVISEPWDFVVVHFRLYCFLSL